MRTAVEERLPKSSEREKRRCSSYGMCVCVCQFNGDRFIETDYRKNKLDTDKDRPNQRMRNLQPED